ncbi:MAG: zinc-ribbon domain-containing protein [Streptosporangiaceae bacterium]
MFCTRCGSRQRDDAAYCSKCGSPLGEQKPQVSGQIRMPGLSGEAGASRQPITSADQRTHLAQAEYDTTGSSSKRRPARLWIVGVLVLLVIGAGSYIIYSVTQSGSPALSSAQMSLAGISVAPPQGWTSFPVSQPSQVTMAPPGSGSCSANSPGGSLRCVEAVTLFRVPSSMYSGNSPQQGLQQLASGRFSAVHARQVSVLSQQSFAVGGCPAYKKEWRVSWAGAPDTLESYVTVKTRSLYQGHYLAAVFIRLSVSSKVSPQALMNTIVSSIQCN